MQNGEGSAGAVYVSIKVSAKGVVGKENIDGFVGIEEEWREGCIEIFAAVAKVNSAVVIEGD